MLKKPWPERLGELIAQGSIRYRWLVIVLSIAIAVAISFGAANLRFAPDYRVFFGNENPDFIANEKAQDTFGRPDNIAFLIIPKTGNVYDEEVIRAIHALTDAAWQLPYVSRVDSLTNFQSTRGENDNLIVEDLVFNPDELDDARIREIMAIASSEPLLDGFVISRDNGATLVNAVIQVPSEVPNIASALAQNARSIRQNILANHPSIDIHIAGVVMLSAAFEEAGVKDSQTLIPAVYLFIIVVLLIAMRSVSAAFASLLVIALSTLVAMGIGGFTGVLLTPISLSAPTIVLTIAVADAIHIMATVKAKIQAGAAKQNAIISSISLNFTPIAITSLTTIVGFLALNFSDSPPFHHLGNISAAGIFAAWIFSITFLPALLSALPMKFTPLVKNAGTPFIEKLASFVILKSKWVFFSTLIFCVGLVTAIPKIEINDQWSQYFDNSLEFKKALDATEPFFGTDTIEFIIDSGKAGEVTNPEFVTLVDNFNNWLRQQSDVVAHSYSVSDIIKRINKNINNDDPSFYSIPTQQKLIGQYMLVYELSLPYGLDLNDRVDINRQKTRVTATTKDISTEKTKAFIEKAKSWFAVNTESPNLNAYQLEVAGSKTLFAYVAERNIDAMFESAIYLVLAIFIILSIAFRSISIGFVSIFANAIPLLATFGAWALLVGVVGFSVAAVGAVAVGLIVDFTVHFLSKYLRAKNLEGKTVEASIRYAFSTAGNAIFVTTIVLAAGFAVLITSTFKLNADLGLLTALAVIFAMLVNLLLLPAGLLLTQKNPPRNVVYD